MGPTYFGGTYRRWSRTHRLLTSGPDDGVNWPVIDSPREMRYVDQLHRSMFGFKSRGYPSGLRSPRQVTEDFGLLVLLQRKFNP